MKLGLFCNQFYLDLRIRSIFIAVDTLEKSSLYQKAEFVADESCAYLIMLNNTIIVNFFSRQICDSGGKFLMCPLCDESIGCQFWNISDICLLAQVM